ncbi:protein TadG, associated with Flp pilus assembly [Enterobacteriaceae bacterium BIT-l23]|uniref:TadE/TadG family type IV pilus assembly protein n=1 Tax=Jejubacter sp. L23 TaxID=3092086 RepID=UPI00158509F9|nr:protein TadG, associated with Flp pilus assembly [Enterobacteriaceae bacterium BIT-l23]
MSGQLIQKYLLRLARNQDGAFAVSFVLASAFIMAMLSMALDGSRYITERARLSDSLEQAALALTSEDNPEGDPRNDTLARHYISAYMRHNTGIAQPVIRKLQGVSAENARLFYTEFRVSARVNENSWLASDFFPSFDRSVTIGNNGAARKFRSYMDVMFVTDFSGSMKETFDNHIKIDELKRIVLQLAQELYHYELQNKVGFVPFAYGTRQGDACNFQFVSKFGKLPEDYLVRPGGSGKSYEQYQRVADAIDYTATVERIPYPSTDFIFPYSQTPSDSFCLRGTVSFNLPLSGEITQVNTINTMTPNGGTLVASGMLLGTQYLMAGDAPRKVLVVVSDGQDDPTESKGVTNISQRLVDAGMCNKIRRVLTTKESVGKLAFIAIGYQPTMDWESCVGKNNFFLPQDVPALRDAMRRAVFEEVGHNTLKDE